MTRQEQTFNDPRWSFVRRHTPDVRAWLTTLSELLDEMSSREASPDCAPNPSIDPTIDSTLRLSNGSQLMDGTNEDTEDDTQQSFDKVLNERLRQRAAFERYEKHFDIFPSKQWAAICLRYRDGLSEPQIAQHLHVGRTAINNRLKRARLLLEEEERKLRAEAIHIFRRDVDS